MSYTESTATTAIATTSAIITTTTKVLAQSP